VLAALVYNHFLERELEMVRAMVTSGYARGKISPPRAASWKLDHWREQFRNAKPEEGS